MSRKRSYSAISIILILTFSFSFLVFPMGLPNASAINPIVVQVEENRSLGGNTGTINQQYTSFATVIGNMLAIGVTINYNSGIGGTNPTCGTLAITDSQLNSWTLDKDSTCLIYGGDNSGVEAYVYHTVATANTKDIVTATWTGFNTHGGDTQMALVITEVSGASPTVFDSGSNIGTSTGSTLSFSLSTVVTWPASAFMIGAISTDCNCNQNPTPPAGFSPQPSNWGQAGGSIYTTSASVTSPGSSNFVTTLSTGGGSLTRAFAMVGVAFALNSVVINVVSCNFFQLQCWLYPMFWMGMYLAFFIGIGMAFEVSDKAFLYLILSGATIASLIEIQMGIMTPLLPISLIVLNIAYSFRIDQLASRVFNREGMKQ